MSSSDPTPRQSRSETVLAFSIIFFALALLSLLLGWAEGVHRGLAYRHLPIGGWLVVTAILGGLGVICLIWSRATKRS